ncbi:MAG TPA: GxxExxY protein [Candidatus Methylomirabilis sp.]|nr:GxxExxY protein [Candidatus Methylomirabilis sp.]
MDINPLTKDIIGAALQVHRALGPALLESAYEACLAHELAARELTFERQRSIPLAYGGEVIEAGFRAELVVENAVLLELKSVEQLLPIHTAQVLTYLKLTGVQLGLLINFNVTMLQHGIRRVVLGLRE